MKQTIKVTALTEWKDVTLKKYLEMMGDIEAYKDDQEAVDALMLHHLAGIPYEELTNVSAESYNILKEKLSKFLKPQDMELQKFVTIGDVEYGFEPNLSNMSYGAYADITKFGQITIDENWSKIMNILYRPVEKKLLDTYTISKYEGTKGEGKWLDVPMSVHFGALFFFIHFVSFSLSCQ